MLKGREGKEDLPRSTSFVVNKSEKRTEEEAEVAALLRAERGERKSEARERERASG